MCRRRHIIIAISIIIIMLILLLRCSIIIVIVICYFGKVLLFEFNTRNISIMLKCVFQKKCTI